jgi:hypothetical protein
LILDFTNIVRSIKSKRVKWMGHVARMGKMRHAYNIFVGKHEGRDHSEDLGVEDLGEMGRKLWTGFIWLRMETGGGIL